MTGRLGAKQLVATGSMRGAVTDPTRGERLHRPFGNKYTLAWLGSFVDASFADARSGAKASGDPVTLSRPS